VNLPFITADASGPKHFTKSITRAVYENLVDSLLQRTLPPCSSCLRDSGISKKDVNEVLLVGGMTRMPKVTSFLSCELNITSLSSILALSSPGPEDG